MIGQKHFKTVCDNTQLSHFTILHGKRGSQFRQCISYLLKGIKAIYCEPSIESVRNARKDALTDSSTTAFVFLDGDKMLGGAKSVLLKITEETPEDAYFIMCTTNITQVPQTLISRANVLTLDDYSEVELLSYAKLIQIPEPRVSVSICKTPGDLDMLAKYDVIEFIGFVNKVITSISEVSLANALKIGNSLSLKKDAEGYDIQLFLQAFDKLISVTETRSIFTIARLKLITTRALRDLMLASANKQMIFDNWVMKIREADNEYQRY